MVTRDDAPVGDAVSGGARGDEYSPTGEYGLFPRERGLTPLRVLFVVGAVAFVSFWAWALFFIDKTAVNKIEDRAWAERAEEICAPVKQSLRRLDLETRVDPADRSVLVVQSTDLLGTMLDDVISVEPSDPKGRDIVPDWIADYRTLLQDRYNYAERLRDGQNVQFSETAVQGVPITERLETFAGDNEMPSCAPPRGGVL